MTLEEQLKGILGEEKLEEKIEEKRKYFSELITRNLAVKLVAKDNELNAANFIVIEYLNQTIENLKQYNCLDEMGYFTIKCYGNGLEEGKVYSLREHTKEKNEFKRTIIINSNLSPVKTEEININGKKILIGKPVDFSLREYKNCTKCREKNCIHEKTVKKMATLKINSRKVIAFDYSNEPLINETCAIGIEKLNPFTGEKEIIASKIIHMKESD